MVLFDHCSSIDYFIHFIYVHICEEGVSYFYSFILSLESRTIIIHCLLFVCHCLDDNFHHAYIVHIFCHLSFLDNKEQKKNVTDLHIISTMPIVSIFTIIYTRMHCHCHNRIINIYIIDGNGQNLLIELLDLSDVRRYVFFFNNSHVAFFPFMCQFSDGHLEFVGIIFSTSFLCVRIYLLGNNVPSMKNEV